jgi:mRNA-degrading endonuclease toxin of MazEF toxin-antitoxin module
MIKYFLNLLDWCKVKLLIVDGASRDVFFKEGEVWWCSIGFNVGEEEFGKGSQFARPVLILKKFTNHSFFGIPLSGHRKTGSWYMPINVGGRQGSLMLNQGRTLDGRRLLKKMTTIQDEQYIAIKVRFAEFYRS